MKDPAFLFYPSDFLTGTMFMSDEQVGKYIRLLCVQHQYGTIDENHMKIICKSHDKDIISKFQKDGSGNYFNQRLKDEIDKRKRYCESRSANKLGKKKSKNHMKNISKSYEDHMGNININKDIDFNVFWDQYHLITKLGKTDRDASERYWKKLTKAEKEKAIEMI